MSPPPSPAAAPDPLEVLAALPLEVLPGLYQLSQSLFTLVRLGLPEHLQTQGPTPLDELADATAIEPKLLHHLLETARGLGLLARDERQCYCLTDKGRRLCADDADSVLPFLSNLEDGYAAWGALHQGLTTGQVPFQVAYDSDIYPWLASHPHSNRQFNRFMEITVERWLAATGDGYPFAGHLVDLGGNTGALTARLLTQFPALRATLFDLEQTLGEAPARLAAAGVAARCALVAGSFFETATIPTDGDLYLFSRVLLNWSDPQVVTILTNCRRAMPTNARLLILDFVRPVPTPPDVLFQSLNLWVMFGARFRTREEFEALLARAGFVATRWIPIGAAPAPGLFLLEASPG